jgi:hypothetical protein
MEMSGEGHNSLDSNAEISQKSQTDDMGSGQHTYSSPQKDTTFFSTSHTVKKRNSHLS